MRIEGGLSNAAAARQFDTMPKTVAKWVNRFEAEGADGLRDRSSRPHSSPSQTPLATCAAVEALRRQRRPASRSPQSSSSRRPPSAAFAIGPAQPNRAPSFARFLLMRLSDAGPRRAPRACKGPTSETLQLSGHTDRDGLREIGRLVPNPRKLCFSNSRVL